MLVVFLLGLGLVYPVPDALACSCAESPRDAVALRRTDAVFSGRVVDTAGPIFSGGSNGYAIVVETTYKGRVYETQWVFSEPQEASCGIELTLGKRYLVFAHGEDAKQLFTSSCSNTHVLNEEPNLQAAGTLIRGRSRSSPPDVLFALMTVAAGFVAYMKGKKHQRTSGDGYGAGQ